MIVFVCMAMCFKLVAIRSVMKFKETLVEDVKHHYYYNTIIVGYLLD